MKLICYPLRDNPVEIAPGRVERDWMDEFPNHHAYRCLPLTIANSTGWELLVPSAFRATWNGGPLLSDVEIESPAFGRPFEHRSFVNSHFSHGVLTFSTGYLFRTEPGWDLWVGGAPNWIKHGIQPLTGIVESNWLTQSFTMNWRFTAPGTVEFKAGEPFALVMPVPHAAIDDVEPVIKDLKSDPEWEAHSIAWRKSRYDFIDSLHNRDPATLAEGWQKHYFKGVYSDGQPGPSDHINKRRLKPPRKETD